MRVLLQVEHPRQEKSPTTRHAPNDLALSFFEVDNKSESYYKRGLPQQEKSPTTRASPNDLALYF